MNLRDLKYLLALKEHKNFSKAAKASFVSQPAMSMQIKKLEEELGVQLIERDKKIGAIPTLAPYLFPKILPNLSKQFKELKVFLIEDKTNILLDKIVNGQVDCGFLALPIDNIDLNKELIFEDKFYLAVHKTNKLFKKKITTQFDLLDQDLLLLEEGHCLRNQALAVCSLKGINENQDFRATSLETLRQMIENGNGITI